MKKLTNEEYAWLYQFIFDNSFRLENVTDVEDIIMEFEDRRRIYVSENQIKRVFRQIGLTPKWKTVRHTNPKPSTTQDISSSLIHVNLYLAIRNLYDDLGQPHSDQLIRLAHILTESETSRRAITLHDRANHD